MNARILEKKELDDGHRLRVKLLVPEADNRAAMQEALDVFRAQMGVDEQKNPDIKNVIIEGMGEEAFNRMVANFVAPLAAPSAINELGLETMFNPEPVFEGACDMLSDGDCVMEIDLILKPSYELSSYEPVTVKMPAAQVADEAVDNQIAQTMDRFAEYQLAAGDMLEEGDCGMVELHTTKDGQPVKGLSGDNQLVHLERGLMPDGFIDGFIGMKVGETRSFDFDGPKEDAVSAEDVESYHVVATVNDKRRRVVPACTDSFVKKHFSDVASTADGYREKVRADMQKQVDEQVAGQRDAMVDDALARRLQAKIPDIYYEHAQDDILRSLQQQLRRQQMTLEQYIQQQGMQENQFQMMLMMQAASVLKCGFALDALYRHMDDSIDDQDIDAALGKMAPGHEAEARREFDQRDTWFAVREVAERLKAHTYAMATATFEE